MGVEVHVSAVNLMRFQLPTLQHFIFYFVRVDVYYDGSCGFCSNRSLYELLVVSEKSSLWPKLLRCHRQKFHAIGEHM